MPEDTDFTAILRCLYSGQGQSDHESEDKAEMPSFETGCGATDTLG